GRVHLVAQLDVDVRPGVAEARQRGRQQLRAGGLERADPDAARLAGRERVEVGPDGAEPGRDVRRVAEDELARLRQRDGARAARALDQAVADGPLERGDLLRHRALRVAQLRSRLGEGAGARYRGQGDEVADLDAGQ